MSYATENPPDDLPLTTLRRCYIGWHGMSSFYGYFHAFVQHDGKAVAVVEGRSGHVSLEPANLVEFIDHPTSTTERG